MHVDSIVAKHSDIRPTEREGCVARSFPEESVAAARHWTLIDGENN